MVLTDREIRIALKARSLVIEPEPKDDSFSSSSVDLTLDDEITVFEKPVSGIQVTLDPHGGSFRYHDVEKKISASKKIPHDNGYDLEPKTLILGWTIERVDLNILSKIAARVEGKSSLARLGLGVHITAPTIHSGFSGRIRLEIVNHGHFPIRLRRGMRICQLIFEQTLGTPDAGYSGQFLGQS